MAVLRGPEVLARRAGIREEPYASRVFNDLHSLMGETGLGLEDVELFAVGTGPGSFTGLRVGLAAIKGWAEALGRPISAVSCLAAIAAQSQAEGILAPVMDARGGRVFGAVYRRNSGAEPELLGEEVVLTLAEYGEWIRARLGNERTRVVTPDVEVVRAAFSGAGGDAVVWEEVSRELAPVIGLLGQARANRGELIDALRLEANYVRKPDAEVKWAGQ